jgi:hypothetical protein
MYVLQGTQYLHDGSMDNKRIITVFDKNGTYVKTIDILRKGLPFTNVSSQSGNDSLRYDQYANSFDISPDSSFYVLSELDVIMLDGEGRYISQFCILPGLSSEKARELMPAFKTRGSIMLSREGKILVTTGDMFDEPGVLVFDSSGNLQSKITNPSFSKLSLIVADAKGNLYLPDVSGRVYVYDENLSFIKTIELAKPLPYFDGPLQRMAAFPDGKLAAVGTGFYLYDSDGKFLINFIDDRGDEYPMLERSVVAVDPEGRLIIVSSDQNTFKAKQPIMVYDSSSYILEHVRESDRDNVPCCPVLMPLSLAYEGLKAVIGLL